MVFGSPRIPAAVSRLFLILLLALLAGCSSAQKKKAPGAVIENQTGRTIRTVVYRSCGLESSEWKPLIDKSLRPQQKVGIDLPLIDCLDLKAEYADGRLAGTQENVQRRFPLYWVLQ